MSNKPQILQLLQVVVLAITVLWDQLSKFHANLGIIKTHKVKVLARPVNRQTIALSFTLWLLVQLLKILFVQQVTNVKIILCMLQHLVVLVISKAEQDKQHAQNVLQDTTARCKLFLIQLNILAQINSIALKELQLRLFVKMVTYVQVQYLHHKQHKLNVLLGITVLQELSYLVMQDTFVSAEQLHQHPLMDH